MPRNGIFIGAPHTSNWDFVLALMLLWHDRVPPHILVKKEFFRWPFGYVMRGLGCVPVDRSHPGGMVGQLAEMAGGREDFTVVVAAEGTRSKGEYWKSGFYRLALETGLPVTLGFVDGPSRTTGTGPSVTMTGDVKADMDVLREFYADKRGLKPRHRTEPRLRDELDG
ncbi:1-acyl-sn-glycerol-3-phosphate acyltransferase [Spongisporangium articulatum]|uniref:1-acyl-sn-glycerol-3-phosphate acyltransferase n=1 Tax=Spongisporangium articulatum TaxID=3362603 RepID=A0ABW8AJ52_9ACTN